MADGSKEFHYPCVYFEFSHLHSRFHICIPISTFVFFISALSRFLHYRITELMNY